MFLFNQFGDLERCTLRPAKVHSADGWRDVMEPVVTRDKERKMRLFFRGNAAFASPEMYEYLEAEGFLYAIRLPANRVLQESGSRFPDPACLAIIGPSMRIHLGNIGSGEGGRL
jgi:hypothetical protein